MKLCSRKKNGEIEIELPKSVWYHHEFIDLPQKKNSKGTHIMTHIAQ